MDADRRLYSSGTTWEPVVGYSRAVRVGAAIYVAGTTATGEDGRIVGPGDPTHRPSRRSATSSGRCGRSVAASRRRPYPPVLRHIADWEQVGRAHGEFFREIRPACTLVEVSGLVDPAMLVEVEAEAVIA
jgi:enamine deaminase RidA (YjgF/YER057c/UK114 family)